MVLTKRRGGATGKPSATCGRNGKGESLEAKTRFICPRIIRGFPHSSVGKESACKTGDAGSIPGLGNALEKEMATHSSTLAGKSHGQRSLAGYSPGCHKSWTQLGD